MRRKKQAREVSEHKERGRAGTHRVQKEVSDPNVVRVTGGCELSNTGAANHILVFCKTTHS